MMARRGAVGLLAGGVAAVLGGCSNRNTLLYKMTIEVDTPQGLASGFAVREVRYSGGDDGLWRLPIWFGESRPQWRLKGEAVTVDLGDGNALFALLCSQKGQSDYAGRDVWKMWRDLPKTTDGLLQLWPPTPGAVPLWPMEPLPMLVTFRNIADPTSVERVDPANLAASFGPGYRLRRISVEITDEPVTTGIGRRLEWLREQKGALQKVPFSERPPSGTPLPLASNLTERDFAQGVQK